MTDHMEHQRATHSTHSTHGSSKECEKTLPKFLRKAASQGMCDRSSIRVYPLVPVARESKN